MNPPRPALSSRGTVTPKIIGKIKKTLSLELSANTSQPAFTRQNRSSDRFPATCLPRSQLTKRVHETPRKSVSGRGGLRLATGQSAPPPAFHRLRLPQIGSRPPGRPDLRARAEGSGQTTRQPSPSRPAGGPDRQTYAPHSDTPRALWAAPRAGERDTTSSPLPAINESTPECKKSKRTLGAKWMRRLRHSGRQRGRKCRGAMPESCKLGSLQTDFRISSIAAFLTCLHPIAASASYGRYASGSLEIVENRFSTNPIRTLSY